MPVSACEHFAALRRKDAVIRDRQTGKPLSAKRIRRLIADKRLFVFFAKSADGKSVAADLDPRVVDKAEALVQTALKGETSTIRSHAAGTCGRSDELVEEEGYVLFGWVLLEATTDETLSVAKIQQRELHSDAARSAAASE